MTKDIYEILADKLNEAGYGFAADWECEKSRELITTARFALMERLATPKNYQYMLRSEASKFNMTPDRMEILLAIARETTRYVNVSALANKYEQQFDSLWINVCSLQLMGYLDYRVSRWSDNKDVYVSDRGLMCLISERPIRSLDSSPFIKLTDEELALIDVPCPQDPVKPSSAFHDKMGSLAQQFIAGDIYVGEFVSKNELSLSKPENVDMKKAFSSFGFYSLTDDQKAFIFALCFHFMRKGVEPFTFDDGNLCQLKEAATALVTAGLVVIPPADSGINNKEDQVIERYLLSPDVVGAVFHGMTQFVNYSTICKQADVRKCDKIESKELLFDEEMSKQVSCIKTLVHPKKAAELMKRLSDIGRKSLTCLFYGTPGTGKTELCLQIAKATGRDCIIVDPAKISGAFWGDSEKNIREVFRAYKYMQKISDRAPILVFNEADGLISKRFTRVERCNEKSENAVQGIILQELEDFEGIFIATTNLQDNLDVACDRRFLFKMRFDNPSAQIRSGLILKKVKGISKEDADTIADEFELSGGQIDNIASKCIIEQFITGENVPLEKLRSICRQELSFRDGKASGRAKIGFIRY